MAEYIQFNKGDCGLGTPCLICGDSVKIQYPNETPKICDKCKAAVMAMRAKMDGEERECISHP